MVGVGPLTLWFRELTERPEYRYLEGYEAGLCDLCHAVGGTWWLYGRGRPYSLTEAQLGYHLAAVHYYVTHRYRLPVETTSGRVWDESVWPRCDHLQVRHQPLLRSYTPPLTAPTHSGSRRPRPGMAGGAVARPAARHQPAFALHPHLYHRQG